jgi:Zn-dependent alcohol dehydrogenase
VRGRRQFSHSTIDRNYADFQNEKSPSGKGSPRTGHPQDDEAAALDRFGPPSVLRLHRLPVPKPGPREVLIALHVSGVGIWDASVRDGSWRPYERMKFPLVPGTDGAGIVMAKGARVGEFQSDLPRFTSKCRTISE